MRNRTLSLLCLLALVVSSAAFAQETPTARFTAYLQTMAKATSLQQVRPFFSQKAWNASYADLGPMTPQDEAEVIKMTVEDLKGWAVKSEKIQGGKAELVVGAPKGEPTTVLMIQQNGRWVIDG